VTIPIRGVLAVVTVGLVATSMSVPASANVPEQRPAAPPTTHARSGLADTDGNRISDGLDRRLEHPSAGRRDIVVTFADRASLLSARVALGANRVSATFSLIDGFAASLTDGQIRSLAERPGVLRVEQDFAVHTLDDASNDDYGVTAARKSFGATGAGVMVCIPDSGVALGHEQLDSKGPIPWLDLIGSKANPYDDMGHGTVVASLALGDGVGPGSIAGRMKGVAPDAALAAVKVLDSTGYGDDSLAVQGVEWCAAKAKVDVISLSLGSDVPSDGEDALSKAVDAATAAGKIVVAAAGNSGDGPGTITSPGSAVTAITVGAVAEWSAQSGALYRSEGPYLAPFSSRGPTIDDRIKPDVVAPGVTVGAAKAGSTSTYVVESGTSMATPFVAGTAALLRQLQPGWTQSQVRSAIEGTAFDAGPSGKDNDWGAGLLDGYGAVAQAAGASGSTPFPLHRRITGSVADNGTWSTNFELSADDLSVPIAATITTQGSVICVIDLGPLGCFQYGFAPDLDASLSGSFDLASSTCPAGDECTAGRQETLHFTPTEPGTYTITVFPAGDGDGSGGSFAIDLFTGPIAGTPAPSVHVADLDRSSQWVTSNRWRAKASIEVHDKNHAPVVGAFVTGVWTGNTTVSCTTDVGGRCTVNKRFARSRASALFTVTIVQATGYGYRAGDNHDAEADSNGTKITVARPA
jgi:serine protease AprX